MVLKLYSTAYSSGGGGVVALVLAEKQIPFEHVVVDTHKREQKTPEFLAMHPFGQVPVIVSIFSVFPIYIVVVHVNDRTTMASSYVKAAESAGISWRNIRTKGHLSSPQPSKKWLYSSRPHPSSLQTFTRKW
jgi:hypothetical protein